MTNYIETPKSIRLTNIGNVDWFYGGGEEAYDSLASANLSVPSVLRLGRTVGVFESDVIVEYWWKEGIQDEDLVLKTSTAEEIILTDTVLETRHRITLENGVLVISAAL